MYILENYHDVAPDIICDFLQYLKVNKDYSEKTIHEYFLDLQMFFRYLKRDRGGVDRDTDFNDIDIMDADFDFIKSVSKLDVVNFIYYLRTERIGNERSGSQSGISAVSASRKLACLKSFYRYYCTQSFRLLDKDPTRGVEPPRTKVSVPSVFTESECNDLLNSITGLNKERDACIIMLCLTDGFRISEIAGMNVSDIIQVAKEGEGFITIKGKGNKQRRLFLPANCIETLNQYMSVRNEYKPVENEKALFLSRKHNRISTDAIQRLVKKAMLQANLSGSGPHKLRHTAATLMLKNGVDIRTIQEVLGHGSLSTTQIYTHISNDDLRIAAEANPISKK